MFSFRQLLVASQSVVAVLPAGPQLSSHSSLQYPSLPNSSPQHHSSPSNNYPYTFSASSLHPACSNPVSPHHNLFLTHPSCPHYSLIHSFILSVLFNLLSFHGLPICPSPQPLESLNNTLDSIEPLFDHGRLYDTLPPISSLAFEPSMLPLHCTQSPVSSKEG